MPENIFNRISIPKPCHEDWTKMTPNEKGAFCASCQKSVHDFTNKSSREVKNILEKNKGKNICGRFSGKQLKQPATLEIPIHELTKMKLSPIRAFAAAIFIAFGSTLFSCTDVTGQIVGEVKVVENPDRGKVRGMVAYSPIDTPEAIKTAGPDTIIPPKPVCSNPEIPEEAFELLGDVMYVTEEHVETVQESIIREPEMPAEVIAPPDGKFIVGQMISVIEPYEHDSVLLEDLLPDAQQEETPDPVKLPETDPEKPGSPELNPSLRINSFPNPSNGPTTFIFETASPGLISISLFDLSGRYIRMLLNEHREAGKHQFKFDIGQLPSGNYICVLKDGQQQATCKVVMTD